MFERTTIIRIVLGGKLDRLEATITEYNTLNSRRTESRIYTIKMPTMAVSVACITAAKSVVLRAVPNRTDFCCTNIVFSCSE